MSVTTTAGWPDDPHDDQDDFDDLDFDYLDSSFDDDDEDDDEDFFPWPLTGQEPALSRPSNRRGSASAGPSRSGIGTGISMSRDQPAANRFRRPCRVRLMPSPLICS